MENCNVVLQSSDSHLRAVLPLWHILDFENLWTLTWTA